MSRTVPAGLQAHINSFMSTLGRLFTARVNNPGVDAWRFVTDIGENIVYGGNAYHRLNGPIVTSMTFYSDGTACVASIDFAATEDTHVSTDDLDHHRLQDADVYVDVFNYMNTAQGHVRLLGGFTTDASWDKNTGGAQVTLGGLLEQANDIVPLVMGSTCDNILGDARCKVDLDDYKQSGTVSTVQGVRVFDISISETNGYWSNGLIVFTSGDNVGYSYHIRLHESGNRIWMKASPRIAINNGDAFDIYPGCNYTPDDCYNKYNNMANHLGFPFTISDSAVMANSVEEEVIDFPEGTP